MKEKKLRFFPRNLDYTNLSSPEFEAAYENYIEYFLKAEENFPQQVREIFNQQVFQGRVIERILVNWPSRMEVSFLDHSLLMLLDVQNYSIPGKPIYEETWTYITEGRIWCYEPTAIWYCEELTIDESCEFMNLDVRTSRGLLSLQFQDAGYFDSIKQKWVTGGPNL